MVEKIFNFEKAEKIATKRNWIQIRFYSISHFGLTSMGFGLPSLGPSV